MRPHQTLATGPLRRTALPQALTKLGAEAFPGDVLLQRPELGFGVVTRAERLHDIAQAQLLSRAEAREGGRGARGQIRQPLAPARHKLGAAADLLVVPDLERALDLRRAGARIAQHHGALVHDAPVLGQCLESGPARLRDCVVDEAPPQLWRATRQLHLLGPERNARQHPHEVCRTRYWPAVDLDPFGAWRGEPRLDTEGPSSISLPDTPDEEVVGAEAHDLFVT